MRIGLGAAIPNPTVGDVAFSIGLATKGHLRLAIYDVTGRLVRVVVDEERDPGLFREAWDGRNSDGRRVAAGVYFVRAEAPGIARSRKVVLIK